MTSQRIHARHAAVVINILALGLMKVLLGILVVENTRLAIALLHYAGDMESVPVAILTQISNIVKVILPQKLVMMAARLYINVMNVLIMHNSVQYHHIGPMLFIVQNLILLEHLLFVI